MCGSLGDWIRKPAHSQLFKFIPAKLSLGSELQKIYFALLKVLDYNTTTVSTFNIDVGGKLQLEKRSCWDVLKVIEPKKQKV